MDDDLVITYTATGGWEFEETHLWIGDDIANMPQTRTGNPKVGNFPYHSGDITGATSYSVVIPLENLPFSCPGDAMEFLVAAHAAVRKPDGSGGFQTETGWGDGDHFVGNNWGTFCNITLTCADCGSPAPNPTGDCETAFANGGDGIGTCFIGADFDGDMMDDGFTRWGWSNSLMQGESPSWPIYAGAGQCNLSNGTLVGTLTADYSGSTVVVTYDMDPGFTMSELHLYVGDQPLARDVNGEFTVALGQFPIVVEDLDASSHSEEVTGLSGPVFVVAHAVVCGL